MEDSATLDADSIRAGSARRKSSAGIRHRACLWYRSIFIAYATQSHMGLKLGRSFGESYERHRPFDGNIHDLCSCLFLLISCTSTIGKLGKRAMPFAIAPQASSRAHRGSYLDQVGDLRGDWKCSRRRRRL